jgi:ArsR family transcriptional regulator
MTTDTDLVRIARALADPTRVRILRALAKCDTLCCGAITKDVDVRPATVSHHLRILLDAGLVETRRHGQYINVRVNPERLGEFCASLAAIFSSDDRTGRNRRKRTQRVA